MDRERRIVDVKYTLDIATIIEAASCGPNVSSTEVSIVRAYRHAGMESHRDRRSKGRWLTAHELWAVNDMAESDVSFNRLSI